jgi:hypothetical protein
MAGPKNQVENAQDAAMVYVADIQMVKALLWLVMRLEVMGSTLPLACAGM